MDKALLRKQIGELRKALSPQEVKNLSRLCVENLLSLPIYLEASIICIYMPIKNEVETEEIIKDAFKRGKQVAAPKIMGDEMFFYYVTDKFTESRDYNYERWKKDKFSEGAYGILELKGEEALQDETALIIMPGLVFDEDKNRIGYGGGYYDRYLEKHKEHRTVALAYDFQIVGRIEKEVFDICPDVVVTDKRVIGKSEWLRSMKGKFFMV